MTTQPLPWFVGLEGLKAYQNRRRFIALDFETTALDRGSALNPDNHIVLACWDIVENGEVTRKFHFGDEYSLSELEQDIKDSDFVVAHNAKFELGWLKRCGMELRDILVFDTMLAEWVIGGNRYRPSELGLEASAQRYGLGAKLPLAGMMIKKGVCPSTIPKRWLLDYCFKDVELCRNLFDRQERVLTEDGLLHLALVRNLTCSVLADIEFNGAELDRELVSSTYDESVREYRQIEQELAAIADGTNLSSPKQRAALLFEKLRFKPLIDPRTKQPYKTPTGSISTNADIISKLQPETEEQEKFLALYLRRNKLASLLTKNLEFFKGVVEEKGGKFFAIFNQGFTQTHRLSSSGLSTLFRRFKTPRGVQFQNLPREYKKLFTAHDEDYLVGEADGAQLEFRVACELGEDKVAYREIAEDVDVHKITADTLTNAGEPTSRQQAKASTFAPLFGGMGKSPAQKAYAEFFKKKYSKIAKTQYEWTLKVLNDGYLRTKFGMKFYWPGTKMGRNGYIDNTTSIYNYPIQSSATAEIIPIALIHFWHKIRDTRIVLWSTVHDSLVSRVHKDEVAHYEQLSKECLTVDVYNFLEEVYGYRMRVPLGVGVKVGTHWGQGPEKIWSVFPDGRESFKQKE